MFNPNTYGFEAMENLILNTIYRAGDTVKTIANRLTRAGYKGRIASETSCPLANCLKDLYPGVSVKVDEDSIVLGKVEIDIDGSPLSDFVIEFDSGRFPKLIKGKKGKK